MKQLMLAVLMMSGCMAPTSSRTGAGAVPAGWGGEEDLRALEAEFHRAEPEGGTQLPPDLRYELEVWQETVLERADTDTRASMKSTSQGRIRWLEGKMEELKLHPERIAKDEWRRLGRLLLFEKEKLRLIEGA